MEERTERTQNALQCMWIAVGQERKAYNAKDVARRQQRTSILARYSHAGHSAAAAILAGIYGEQLNIARGLIYLDG